MEVSLQLNIISRSKRNNKAHLFTMKSPQQLRLGVVGLTHASEIGLDRCIIYSVIKKLQLF